jgi:hypothetical protein
VKTVQTAEDDVNRYSVYTIPREYKGTGFLIARINLRYQTAASGTITEVSTEDLRGLTPSTGAGGGGGGGSTEVSDNLFRIQNVSDTTKQIAFDASTITTANTRTITMPDSDVTLLKGVTSLTTVNQLCAVGGTGEITQIGTAKWDATLGIVASKFVATSAYNNQVGTSYTLVLGDNGEMVWMNNASANTVTIPTNASVAFTINETCIVIVQEGAGATTVQGDTGVTVNGVSGGSATISDQFNAIALYKRGTDTWVAIGLDGVA